MDGLKRILDKLLRHEGSHQRTRQIKKTALANVAAKTIALFVQFATVPLTLSYLGQERYGLWMAIASLIAFLQLSDFGIGNALIGLVAKKKAQHSDGEIRALLVYAARLLTLVGATILVLGTVATWTTDWTNFFNIKGEIAQSEVRTSILVFLILFSVGLPLSVGQQIRAGLQQGHVNAALGATGHLINLVLIFVAVHNKAGLPWLIAASMSGTLALQLWNLASLWGKLPDQQRDGSRTRFDAPDLLSNSALFFVLQIAALVSYQSDVLVIAHFLDPAAVTEYSVAFKLFSVPATLLSFFFVGMWPAYSDAFAKNDKSWIVSFFWKSLKISLIANTVLSVLLFLLGAWFIKIWTKDVVQPGNGLLLGMMLWGILNAFGGNLATLLNGMHIVRFQVILAVLSAAFNIALSIVLVKSIGVSGPIWGSVIVLTIAYAVSIVFVVRLFREWKHEKSV
jgi:O-antigen/teichoic acid export membrane protein